MIKVLHLITDLEIGGAEKMLTQVMPPLASKGVLQTVVCLSQPGPLAEEIQRQGHPVVCLGMKPGKPSLRAFVRLLGIIRKESPDIIHSWLYHADLYGGLAAFLTGKKSVWGLHNATLNEKAKRQTRLVVGILSVLSHILPSRIISCSHTAQKEHVVRGYSEKRFIVIPNGFDTRRFQPDPVQRHKIRAMLRLSDSDLLFGNVARFDPQKNHRGLLDAWVKFLEAHPELPAHLILVGRGVDSTNRELNIWLSRFKLTGRVKLLGERSDIPEILNALDVFVLASVGEAFPLALGEAMSCGVLCISTNVGDTAEMLDGNGLLVPPDNRDEMIRAMQKAAHLPLRDKDLMQKSARQRVLNAYSLESMSSAYLDVYQSVLKKSENPRMDKQD